MDLKHIDPEFIKEQIPGKHVYLHLLDFIIDDSENGNETKIRSLSHEGVKELNTNAPEQCWGFGVLAKQSERLALKLISLLDLMVDHFFRKLFRIINVAIISK